MKKLFYLFLALLLPALIFVFLKYAGKNEFTIPVYYEAGVANPPLNCSIAYTKPYRLPDSVWSMPEMIRGEAHVLSFANNTLDIEIFQGKITDEFGEGALWLKNARRLMTDDTRYNEWKTCIFLIMDPMQTVLFDKEGRIRGYYDLRSREEVDRLRVELKILLKKY